MTITFKITSALILACLAAPAFAHGGGGHSGNMSHPVPVGDTDSHHRDTDKDTRSRTVKLNTAQQIKLNMFVSTRLRTLINAYEAALQAGNKGAANRILGEIGQLSRFESGFNTTTSEQGPRGSNMVFEIGTQVHGQVVINGQVVRS
jgi:hypothetical protein